jgi:hypothetical protein
MENGIRKTENGKHGKTGRKNKREVKNYFPFALRIKFFVLFYLM